MQCLRCAYMDLGRFFRKLFKILQGNIYFEMFQWPPKRRTSACGEEEGAEGEEEAAGAEQDR